jgi:hypothetical protein
MIYTVINFLETIKNPKRGGNYYERQRQLTKQINEKNISNYLEGFAEEFKRLNIQYAEAEFSGGHDEGGYDSFVWLDKNKNEVKLTDCVNKSYYTRTLVKRQYDDADKGVKKIDVFYYDECKYETLENISLDDIFWKLGALDQFGSFAGEFNVNGTVLLNVITGEYKLEGNETIEEWQPLKSSGRISVTLSE